MRQKCVAFTGDTRDRCMEFPHGGITRVNPDGACVREEEYSSPSDAFGRRHATGLISAST